jgi:hypothetical protein
MMVDKSGVQKQVEKKIEFHVLSKIQKKKYGQRSTRILLVWCLSGNECFAILTGSDWWQ